MDIERIITGTRYIRTNSEFFCIKSPTLSSIAMAKQRAVSIIDSNKFDIESFDNLKLEMGWTEEKEKYLSVLNKKLEDAKLSYFLNFNRSTKNSVLSKLFLLKEEIKALSQEKTFIYNLSLDGLFDYIVDVLSFFYSCDNFTLQKYNSYRKEDYTEQDIREISRDNNWRSYWMCSKLNLMFTNFPNLNIEQRMIIVWSKFYDSVFESLDAPDDDVVNDDDALDGWFLKQKKDSKKEKSSNISGNEKINSAGEVFIMTKNQHDPNLPSIEEIYEMNNIEGKSFIKQNFNKMKNSEKTSMSDLDFNTVKRNILMENNRRKNG